MKTEQEVRDKLEVLRRELKEWEENPYRTSPGDVVRAMKQERVNALEWVLGEYEYW